MAGQLTDALLTFLARRLHITKEEALLAAVVHYYEERTPRGSRPREFFQSVQEYKYGTEVERTDYAS